MFKNMADAITGSDSLYKPASVLGLNYNEGFCSLCGLIAALLAGRIL